MDLPNLPISDILQDVLDALSSRGCAVLQAPPGAGKTTVVPLAMLRAGLIKGRIILLEPRRLATRAAAERMAATLGEAVGKTVGYRMRGETKTSNHTQIEVVTEGILTRMLQADPSLTGIGAVIFDEFHERSLNADLGLALTWESRGALREDLKVLVMSATLDAAPVAHMLDAPVITSQGRAYPVETRWLARPPAKTAHLEDTVANLVLDALEQSAGSILVFLPGEGEIRRTETRLRHRLPADCVLHTLFGAMDFSTQRAAIRPAPSGRKIVLATAIAETSLTIAGIEVVVDGGLARRARFDPGSGMSRLVTEPVSRAEAEQRRGRAGRLGPGLCFRAWTKGQDGALPAYPPTEIEMADLCSLVLDLAQWGARSTENMAFLTDPNPGAFAMAKDLLTGLGALGKQGEITDHGRKLAAMPLHPRLAHMLTQGGPDAALLAALLGDRDPLRGAPVDLELRRHALKHGSAQANPAALKRIQQEAKRLQKQTIPGPHDWPALAALAYPDRIGLRRKGTAPRWILSGGKEATMGDGDPLASSRLIVATDLDGGIRTARIRNAIGIKERDVRNLFADQIGWANICRWSSRDRRVLTRQQEQYGALVLQDRPWKDAPDDAIQRAALDGVRELGLPLTPKAKRFITRTELLRAAGQDLPDLSLPTLLAGLDTWLLPHLQGIKTAADIKALDILPALQAMLNWEQTQNLNQLAPADFLTPMGRKIPVDYSDHAPSIQLRLQEMFGQKTHPMIAGLPLRITLLSPAGRPVQTTMDLPRFWANSYSDVRKDMRGRYPKHPWPENPEQANPTLRAKPRKP